MMARIPGERFEIDFDDESVAPDARPQTAAVDGTGLIGDVLEREVRSEIVPPTFRASRTATGFPEHKKRTGPSRFKQNREGNDGESVTTKKLATSTAAPDISIQSPRTPTGDSSGLFERQQIDAENKRAIANMSEAEIAAEREELFAGLSPALIQKLLKRSNIDEDPSQFNTESSMDSGPAHNENRRPSIADRKVSFALPESGLQEMEPSPTAARHSITSSPSPALGARNSALSSYEGSELDLSRTSSNTSLSSRRSSTASGYDRKVSFVLPEHIELARKASPTAARHSISSPNTAAINKTYDKAYDEDIAELDLTRTSSNSAMKSPGQRPVDHKRKVSFALPDSQLVPEDRRPSSAASHSIRGGSPSPKFLNETQMIEVNPMDNLDLPRSRSVHFEEPDEGSIHFPQPPKAPELDPNAPTFLDDLHQKFFPNLAHDPSKLAWMAAPTEEENAAYDPLQENVAPKDVRFDFKGQIIPPSQSARISTDAGLHHHGDAPSAAGYTIAELGILSRSAFPAQRSIAMQTAGRILYRLGKGEFGNENLIEAEGPVGERGMLAKGLWEAIEENRIIDTITAEASKETGHRTSIALAQEAVWNWRKGGGRQRKAV